MIILKIFAFIWFSLFLVTTLFFLVGIFIEKKLSEENPIKKLWRKHIVAVAPQDMDI